MEDAREPKTTDGLPGADLLERDREIATIRAAVRGSATTGRFVWIEGPAGIGKTRLVDIARDAGARQGATVLSARCGMLEREIPFGVARQLFDPLLARVTETERAALLDGPAAHLGAVLDRAGGDAARHPQPDAAAAALLGGLFWLTVNAAARTPLVVVIDDAHWADAMSLRFASFLVRRLDGLPACVVLAARDDEPLDDDGLLAELSLDPGAVALRPGPLSRDAVGSVVAGRLPGTDAAVSTACHRATGGNPFYVHELVEAIAADGPGADAADVGALAPVGVARSLLLRLGRLRPEARPLAAAAALMEDGTDLRVLARVAQIPLEAAVDAADDLVRASILRDGKPLGFTHAIVRSVIADDVTPAARASTHARAAVALQAAGAPEDLVVPHLLRTEPAGDPSTVATLRRAATRAVDRGDPLAAVRLLERAVREPAGADTATIMGDLGTSLFHAGRPDQSADMLARAVDGTTDAARRVELRILQAYARLWSHGAGAAYSALEAAQGDAGAAGPGVARALDAELASYAWMSPHEVAAPATRLAGCRDLDGRGPGERLLLGLAALDAIRDRPAHEVRDLALRAWADGRFLVEATSRPVAYYALTHALIACEAPEAPGVIANGIADCRDRGTSYGTGGMYALRSILRVDRGELVGAAVDAGSAAEFSIPTALGIATAWRALVALERGHVDEAGAIFASLDGMAGTWEHVWYFGPYVRGRIALAQGRPHDAIRHLALVGARAESVGGFGLTVPWRAHLVLAQLAAREPVAAAATARSGLEAAERFGAPGGIGRALRVLARTGGRAERVEVLHDACAMLESSWCRLEHGHALQDLGTALLRDGRRREGRAALRTAMDLARECGADGVVKACAQELGVSGARPRVSRDAGFDALTPAEQRVAAMAAEGLTNREIAEILVVTPKTVENQLGAVYRKLGVSSRRRLGDALAGSGWSGAEAEAQAPPDVLRAER